MSYYSNRAKYFECRSENYMYKSLNRSFHHVNEKEMEMDNKNERVYLYNHLIVVLNVHLDHKGFWRFSYAYVCTNFLHLSHYINVLSPNLLIRNTSMFSEKIHGW